MTAITDLSWKRIVAGGVAAHAVAVGALVLAIVVNTILVVFSTGSPSQESISAFNSVVGTQLFPLLSILLTAIAASWVVRRVDADTATLHGVGVGLFAAVIGLGFGAFDPSMLLRFVATVGAGVVGANLTPPLFGE